MNILGISCFYHDAASALLQDGQLVAAVQEERFSRIKHDQSYPTRSIQFCLKQASISAHELDYVVFYEKPLLKFERVLRTNLQTFPKSLRSFNESMLSWFTDKLWIQSILQEEIGIPTDKILFVEHHHSHAASSFFSSPFESSAILTVDGVGEWATTLLAYGESSFAANGRNSLVTLDEQHFPHSLGLLYSAFTAFLGFEVNEGEYKVMGMAPYGTPRYVEKVCKLLNFYQDGSFKLNLEYFEFQNSVSRTFSDRFVDLFGAPRSSESEFVVAGEENGLVNQRDVERSQHYADIAASIQFVTEDILLRIVRYLYKKTNAENLCMAGGVALNSVANGRIQREGPFKRLYVQPAAGDAGGALGAALYIQHLALQEKRSFVMTHCYWGEAHGEPEIRAFLESNDIAYVYYESDELLTNEVATQLAQGAIIGWLQGRFEWGPRALGNRSILADPRHAEIKHVVNEKIKFRELFRPFAPVVLAEHAEQYFAIHEFGDGAPENFMLSVAPVHVSQQDVIPAVSHLGTARCQTLHKKINPRYYQLIEKFAERTGVPVLLNTSFNLRGEPIVSSPQDAYKTFMRSGLDLLVLEKFIIQRPQADV